MRIKRLMLTCLIPIHSPSENFVFPMNCTTPFLVATITLDPTSILDILGKLGFKLHQN